MRPFFALLIGIAMTLQPLQSSAFSWDDVDVNKAVSGGSKLFKAAAGLSDAEEAKLGREVGANVAARYSLVDEVGKVTYVNLVGRTLVRHCSRPGLTYHFGILRSSEINAFAAPGGYVFVTEGLLSTLKDESELAGVLAHEISHITERHIAKAINKANLLGAGQDLAATGGNDVSQYAVLSDFSINLLSKGFSRDDELAADRAGTELAAAAGYEITGLRRSIERLGASDSHSLFQARFNKTHPAAKDRLKVIDRWIEKKHLKASGQRLPFRFQKNLPVPALPKA